MMAGAFLVSVLCLAGGEGCRGLKAEYVCPGGLGEWCGVKTGDVLVSLGGEGLWRLRPDRFGIVPWPEGKPEETTELVVRRKGRLESLAAPTGDLQILCTRYRDGEGLYRLSKRRDPRWDGRALAAYRAAKGGSWKKAREEFDAALRAGLDEPNALWDAARVHATFADWKRVIELGERALEALPDLQTPFLHERMSKWKFLYGRPGEAARHLETAWKGERLPDEISKRIARLKEIEQVRKQLPEAVTAFQAVPDPIGGRETRVRGLGHRTTPEKHRDRWTFKSPYNYPLRLRSPDDMRDFRLSMLVGLEPVTPFVGPRFVEIAFNSRFRHRVLTFGVDDRGVLWAGAPRSPRVGPLASAKEWPERNHIVLQRKGGRADFFVNDVHIGTTFMKPAPKPFFWVRFMNCKGVAEEIALETPGTGAKVEEKEEQF